MVAAPFDRNNRRRDDDVEMEKDDDHDAMFAVDDEDDNDDEEEDEEKEQEKKRNKGEEEEDGEEEESLVVAVSSKSNDDDMFVEIFPEEFSTTSVSQLLQLFRDEGASARVWTHAARLYVRRRCRRECLELLTEACQHFQVNEDSAAKSSTEEESVRILASAGIAHLTQADYRQTSSGDNGAVTKSKSDGTSSSTDRTNSNTAGNDTDDPNSTDESRSMADNMFTRATKINQFFPMTWIGRGMLNLSMGRMDQAHFFFNTTLSQRGQVLPALLGMAAVHYRNAQWKDALETYAKCIQWYPKKSGAPARVGLALASYRLGQVDRAKAAFRRAHDIDPDNVEAMIGMAILDMASLDETNPLVFLSGTSHNNSNRDFRSKTEHAIRLLSAANMMDHSNAMVQNHLANHYFWKWTPVVTTKSYVIHVETGSNIVRCTRAGATNDEDAAAGSQLLALDPGEHIRIGPTFETYIVEDDANGTATQDDDGKERPKDGSTFRVRHAWKGKSTSGLKLWKKDYDRVIALAKGALNSTSVSEIQAESLFLLARVHHIKQEMEQAMKHYDRAIRLAPDLSPARFGLVQTYIWDGRFDEAAAHLRLVLGTASMATDAHAALGLLEAKTKGHGREALTFLKRAMDLDPLNPDLVLLEALALQQQESDYALALDRYKKAVKLMEQHHRNVIQASNSNPMQGDDHEDANIPYDVLANMGVLCHETRKFDDAMKYYARALRSLEADKDDSEKARHRRRVRTNGGADADDGDNDDVRHPDNDLFWTYVSSGVYVTCATKEGGTELLIVSSDGGEASIPATVKIGDHVRLGETFETDVVEIVNDGGDAVVRVQDAFIPPSMTKEKNSEKEGEEEKNENDAGQANAVDRVPMYVKRRNGRLDIPSAISVAFNVARLHEAAGRIVPAIELHKAIVRRHPSYVNSYLRLACIARDCGSLKDCSEWLKSACAVAPGNPEVLTLVGNLHLSLCDWAPAQSVFDQLLTQKVPNVEAYSMLSLGNIYFNNLKTPKKYTKHLLYAADFYKRILNKDKSNAYAANGLGTVLAEKGELFKAKEIFNRVREVSGDSIPDTLLNLGHIYLAQKKHPEALQMYQSYMSRSRKTGAPITSKSRDDDDAEVLLYIAFAYFDWARQTELYNDSRAAPADGRYKKCIDFIEQAMKKSKKENVVLRYNWCVAKLQSANCVLQKGTRNIRRTAQEIQDALDGLEESLPVVQTILQWRLEGKRIPIAKNMLNHFVTQCKGNIENVKLHLADERKKESEAKELRELQRIDAMSQQKEKEAELLAQKERDRQKEEERDIRAKRKMEKVSNLVGDWGREAEAERRSEERKKREKRPHAVPQVAVNEDDDEDDYDNINEDQMPVKSSVEDADADDDKGIPKNVTIENVEAKDIFGDSDGEESGEELVRTTTTATKRPATDENADENGGEEEDDEDGQSNKKRRVLEEDDE